MGPWSVRRVKFLSVSIFQVSYPVCIDSESGTGLRGQESIQSIAPIHYERAYLGFSDVGNRDQYVHSALPKSASYSEVTLLVFHSRCTGDS